MKAQANISKSVARTFRVLELFRELRRPLTAAQVQHALQVPQPSARVLLKELVDIGYLAYTMPARTYFPTARLCALGDWLGSSLVLHEPLLRVVDGIAAELDETTSLCTATSGHVEVLYVRRAGHPLTLQISAGMGSVLWRSAVGRTLLSLRSDDQVGAFLGNLDPRDAPRGRRQREDIAAQIRQIRTQGYFAGYDVFLKGVGAICVPVPRPIAGVPLVLAVAGGKDRIQPREKAILRLIRARLREVPEQRPGA
jgi:DNA-binding IclR family transcriptional regulator